MFALRNISRAAPRSFARISAKAVRPQPSLFRVAAVQPSWTQNVSRIGASFSTSTLRRQDSSVNEELLAKLQSEIAIEKGSDEDGELSENIKEYLDNSPFEVEDKPGHHEVILRRTFGDEKITITLSTADVNNMSDEPDTQDPAMYEDDVSTLVGDSQSGGANTKGAVNQGRAPDGNIRVAPEDRVAPADREEFSDDMDYNEGGQSFPVHATIRVERPGKGALHIEAVAQDGDFMIEDLWHFPSADLADPQTAEKDWQRRTLYTGPPFGNLDEDLQYLLEKYLDERGINTRLALFIPDYIDSKEQKEYIRWLENVQKFVE